MVNDDFDLAQYLYEKEVYQEDIEELDRQYGKEWREELGLCESPIERILYTFLLLTKPVAMEVRLQQEIKTSGGIKRVDFLIGVSAPFRPMFIVECDGDEHHTKKKDIYADKERDRQLLLEYRLPTVRIPGKELMRSPREQSQYVCELFEKGTQG